MFKNPTMLYRCPGAVDCDGTSCETLIVEAEDAADKLAAGWSDHPLKAARAHQDGLAAAVEANDAEMAEIEQKLAAAGLRAVHKGRGVYSLVDADGREVETGLTKDEAKARAGT
jgi:hypothetical protein